MTKLIKFIIKGFKSTKYHNEDAIMSALEIME